MVEAAGIEPVSAASRRPPPTRRIPPRGIQAELVWCAGYSDARKARQESLRDFEVSKTAVGS
jgi:hypothetical protein